MEKQEIWYCLNSSETLFRARAPSNTARYSRGGVAREIEDADAASMPRIFLRLGLLARSIDAGANQPRSHKVTGC